MTCRLPSIDVEGISCCSGSPDSGGGRPPNRRPPAIGSAWITGVGEEAEVLQLQYVRR
jgi:hypothetical protein